MEENWLKVVGAIIVVVVLSVVTLILIARNRPKKPVTIPPPTPKVKKDYGWLWWLAGAVLAVIIAVVLTWGFSTSWGKSKKAVVPVTNSGTQVVIPKEKWSFRWITPLESYDLSVEIAENRNGIFRAVLHDINGHNRDERVAGLTMRWEGENLLGTWTDYVDSGGGNAYLYKASANLWSGWWECNNGKTKVHIEMRKD
jgi:hypothetical protein